MTSTLERSQSRIGRVIPNPNSNPFFNPNNSDQNSSLSHQLILEDPLTHPRLTHQPEVIKIEPVNIAPSPVSTVSIGRRGSGESIEPGPFNSMTIDPPEHSCTKAAS